VTASARRPSLAGQHHQNGHRGCVRSQKIGRLAGLHRRIGGTQSANARGFSAMPPTIRCMATRRASSSMVMEPVLGPAKPDPGDCYCYLPLYIFCGRQARVREEKGSLIVPPARDGLTSLSYPRAVGRPGHSRRPLIRHGARPSIRRPIGQMPNNVEQMGSRMRGLQLRDDGTGSRTWRTPSLTAEWPTNPLCRDTAGVNCTNPRNLRIVRWVVSISGEHLV
jgi:hypothetical protein